MCSPAKCRQCGKTTWSGCGQHVDQVMARVAEPDRCQCRPTTNVSAQTQGTGIFGR